MPIKFISQKLFPSLKALPHSRAFRIPFVPFPTGSLDVYSTTLRLLLMYSSVGTFLCETIMEPTYTCVIPKNTENHKLWSKQKSLRILSSLRWCLFETFRIFVIEVSRLCIYMYQDKRLILYHNFRCFKYLLLRFCLHFIYCPKMTLIY